LSRGDGSVGAPDEASCVRIREAHETWLWLVDELSRNGWMAPATDAEAGAADEEDDTNDVEAD
jgi:hypothetical protein